MPMMKIFSFRNGHGERGRTARPWLLVQYFAQVPAMVLAEDTYSTVVARPNEDAHAARAACKNVFDHRRSSQEIVPRKAKNGKQGQVTMALAVKANTLFRNACLGKGRASCQKSSIRTVGRWARFPKQL